MRVLRNRPLVLQIDELCKRYGKLPHEILQCTPGEFNFDCTIMTEARKMKQREAQLRRIQVFPVVEVD